MVFSPAGEYAPFRYWIDANLPHILKRLPKTFATNNFIEAVANVCSPAYEQACTRFGKNKVDKWFKSYYLPSRKKYFARHSANISDSKYHLNFGKWEKSVSL